MKLPPLSPDVRIVGDAQPKRKSRAQTPSSQGHGHTPDEQTYRRAAKLAGKNDTTPPEALILGAAKVALFLIEWHAATWEHGSNWRVTEAIEALKILKEWLERRTQ